MSERVGRTNLENVTPGNWLSKLAGSICGTAAVEIALKLRAAGEPVAFVGMIDTHYPGITSHARLPKPPRLIEQLTGELIALPREHWRSHLLQLPFRALQRRARLRRGPSDKVRAAIAMDTGLRKIFTSPPGQVRRPHHAFCRGRVGTPRLRGSPDVLGQGGGQGLELPLLPGTHNLMAHEPLIARFAETLKGCIERARHRTADTKGDFDH